MWGSIEVAPGRFDWDDYDEQMELARKNRHQGDHRRDGQHRAAIALPRLPRASVRKADGSVPRSVNRREAPLRGGFGARRVCLDNPQARSHMRNFPCQLAARATARMRRCSATSVERVLDAADLCFCAHTRAAFQAFSAQKIWDA
jgi:beta-galactosidase